jgi:hypothetical protein
VVVFGPSTYVAVLWVEVGLTHIEGRWIASADTPDGRSLGLGYGAPSRASPEVAPRGRASPLEPSSMYRETPTRKSLPE